jgi:hypothetical protein
LQTKVNFLPFEVRADHTREIRQLVAWIHCATQATSFDFNMTSLSDSNGTAPEIIVKLRVPLRLPWAVPPEDIRVLGTVHRGMEFGFLAKTAFGEYVQINGSTTQRLNFAQVEQARREASGIARMQGGRAPGTARPAAAPPSVVTVRKKRRVLTPALLVPL